MGSGSSDVLKLAEESDIQLVQSNNHRKKKRDVKKVEGPIQVKNVPSKKVNEEKCVPNNE